MSATFTFPHLRVAAADPFARGRALGAGAAGRVAASLALYEKVFAHHAHVSWSQVRSHARAYREPIASYDAEIFREIEGIADGARVELEDVLALNARSEIMFGLGQASPQECTAFFADSTATRGGEVLIGQNWDWLTGSRRCAILVELDQGADRPAIAMLPEAGLVGKMGLNSERIGVTVNAMQSSADSGAPCVPIHVILRGILDSPTFEQAVDAVRRAPRAASATYTIACADGRAVAIEGGPGGADTAYQLAPRAGVLAHCNHFLADVDFEDTGLPAHPDSASRLTEIDAFLGANAGALSAELVKQALASEAGAPGAICRRPDPTLPAAEDVSTVASVIIDLTERTLEVADGLPCERAYQRFTPFGPPFSAPRASAADGLERVA